MSKSKTQTLIRGTRMDLGQDRGYGVTVELSDGQIVRAIRRSLSLYSRYRPVHSYQSFDAGPGSKTYEPSPKIRNVLRVDFVPEGERVGLFPDASLYGTPFYIGAGLNYEAPRQYASFVQWREAAHKVFSTEPGWFFDENRGTLHVYVPTTQTRVTLVGALDFDIAYEEEFMWEEPDDPDDDSPSELDHARLDGALNNIPNHHYSWIRDLTLAASKQTLGYMRRKYGSVPAIDGRDVQMDGDSLIQEGKTEWEEIRKDLIESSPGYTPVFE